MKENFDFKFPINFIYEEEYLEQETIDKFNNLIKKLLDKKNALCALAKDRPIGVRFINEIIYKNNNYEIRFDAVQSVSISNIKLLLNMKLDNIPSIQDIYFETFVLTFDKYFNFEKISTELSLFKKQIYHDKCYKELDNIFKNSDISKLLISQYYDSYNSLNKNELFEIVKSLI